MRGKVARRIRKSVYGEDLSHRIRRYRIDEGTGEVKDVGPRSAYQREKKRYKGKL